MIKNVKENGFTLLEIIIAIAIIIIVFVILLGIAFLVLNISSSIQKETQADSLIKEEFEALRNFRDGTQWATSGLGIVNTGSGNPYHLVNSLNEWSLVSGTETVGIFTRKIVFDKVSRDPVTYDIEQIYNLSHNDSDTIKVTITISWSNKTIEDVLYLTNWKND